MITGNEQAFPTQATFNSEGQTCDSGAEGLTILQYFASKAMWSAVNPYNGYDSKNRAKWAIVEADALIEELNKKPTT